MQPVTQNIQTVQSQQSPAIQHTQQHTLVQMQQQANQNTSQKTPKLVMVSHSGQSSPSVSQVHAHMHN